METPTQCVDPAGMKEEAAKQQAYLLELPTDVLAEILFRVPAESLVELRCVCKCWNGLISDEQFIKRHHEHWKSRPVILPMTPSRQLVTEPLSLIYSLILSNLVNGEVKLKDRCNCRGSQSEDRLVDALLEFQKRKHPHLHTLCLVLGSCDGLLLVEVVSHCSGCCREVGGLIVCNPITKSYRLLPPCDSFTTHNFLWTIAFDSSVQRHKIVGMERKTHADYNVRCFMFDLHRGKDKHLGSWKELNCDIPWSFYSSVVTMVACAGGKVHCMIQLDTYESENMLLSLDLLTELFRPINVNLPASRDSIHCWFLSDRVFCCGLLGPSVKDFELWIIDDFDHPVWRKHHVIRNSPMESFDPYRYEFEHAGMFMADEGKLIMNLDGEDLVYDMSSREWTRNHSDQEDFTRAWHCSLDSCSCVRHVNSLVRFD